jgi:signal transduction histidine kinase
MGGNAERSGALSRDQLAAILRGIAEGITVQGPDGELLFANDAGARLCGFATAEALLATPVGHVISHYAIFGEDGRPVPIAELPGRKALAGVESERILGIRVLATGEMRWSVVHAVPVFDEAGRVVQAINVFRDVTDRRALDEERERVRRRLSYLNEASRALDEGPLDVASRLTRLARLAVPRLADGCAVYLPDADGVLLPQVLEPAGRDPSDDGVAAQAVFRSGRVERGRTLITVPMRAQGRTIGVIRLTSDGEDGYDDDDLALAQELADRAALAVEAARLYEESQRAVHDREQLMAWVSHDLRNPLSTISMATELLLRAAGPEQSEKARRAADNTQRAVVRMERLIHDLLDLARIEGGGLPLERGHHDLAQLVAEAIDLHSSIAAEKQLTLVNEARSAPVDCDRERVLQMFANLVDNALKFTPAGGSVRLGAEPMGGCVKAWVADDGPGIPEAERAKIFDRYWQARRDRKGVGLGLAIARGVVEAHGGRIWVEGQPGRGARFCLTLPSA